MSEELVAYCGVNDSIVRRNCVATYDFGLRGKAEVVTTYLVHYRDYPHKIMSTQVESVRHRFDGMTEAMQGDFERALIADDRNSALDALFGIFRPSFDSDPVNATIFWPETCSPSA